MTRFRPAALATVAVLALGAGLGVGGSATAFEIGAMTDTERATLRDEIRAYLLANPEVLMEAIGVLEQREAATQAAGDVAMVTQNADALFDDGHSWVGGNPEGDITLVEFMDYRCGYCKQAFAEVESLVGGDGNIRFILKEFPILGEQSMLASQFAIAVQQVHGADAYKQAHDTLMGMRGDVTPEALNRVAEGLGLPPAPILERMAHPDVAEVIAENRALAQRMQIGGTPTFVVGDRMLRGYVPQAQMEAMVAALRTPD